MRTNSKDRISVLLPTYNSEKYISDSIDSILFQTYDNFELLVINDGSVDNTKDIILSKKDKRIVYIENRKNQGIVRSLNKGLHYSKGSLIARMDADDIALSNRFEIQIDVLKKYSRVDILGAGIQLEEGFSIGYNGENEYIRASLLISNPIIHPTVVMKRQSLFEKRLYYDKHAKDAEDYKLWVDASLNNLMFHNIDTEVLKYRRHSEQVSFVNKATQSLNAFYIAFGYANFFFPEALHNKTQVYYNLLFRKCNNDLEVTEAKRLCKLLIADNHKKKIFDPDIFGLLFKERERKLEEIQFLNNDNNSFATGKPG